MAGSELGSRKGRQLLLLLAGAHGQPVPADVVVDRLWADAEPANGRRVVASLVSRLRATLGSDVIRGDGSGYQLGPLVSVDLDKAEALVREASTRLRHKELGLGAAAAQTALELLAGAPTEADDLSPGAGGSEVSDERLALTRRARLCAGRCLLGLDRAPEALDLARRALANDPLDEEAARLVMAARRRRGRWTGRCAPSRGFGITCATSSAPTRHRPRPA